MNKNVLVYFYSNTCPYCIKFEKKWQDIKNNFSNQLILIDYNININDRYKKMFQYNIEGVPTLVLFYKNFRKKMIPSINLDINDIRKFINNN